MPMEVVLGLAAVGAVAILLLPRDAVIDRTRKVATTS
jgi:hypothetical protein